MHQNLTSCQALRIPSPRTLHYSLIWLHSSILQCVLYILLQGHLGHKYRSGMQQPNAGGTRARSALRWCPCASGMVTTSHCYICTQDGLYTELVVFFLTSPSTNTVFAQMDTTATIISGLERYGVYSRAATV